MLRRPYRAIIGLLLEQATIMPSTLLLLLSASNYWHAYWKPRRWVLDVETFLNNDEGGYANQRSDHVFIYESFLYPKGSRPFGSDSEPNHPTSPSSTISLAALFVADASLNFNRTYIYCTYWRGKRGLLSRSEEKFPLLYQHMPLRQALPVQVMGMPYCRLTVHVALCTFPEDEFGIENVMAGNNDGDGSENNSQLQFMLKFSDQQWGTGRGLGPGGAAFIAHRHFVRDPTAISLPWKHADTTSRQLVFCLSRLILFENWRVLLTALEVHRRLGVNLMVTHVLSTASAIYAFLRHYESTTGLLRIRPAVRLPTLRLLADRGGSLYDPDAEAEQSNHLVMANECLYEYKASAAFIAMLDWDELLITGGGGVEGDVGLPPPRPFSLPQAFQLAAQQSPHAAYFEVNRILGSFHPLTVNDSFYNFTAILEGISTPRLAIDRKLPKLVVIPSRVHGVWIHEARNLQSPSYAPATLSTAYALLLHMSHVGYYEKNDFNLMGKLNGTQFNDNMEESFAGVGLLGSVGLANDTMAAELFALRSNYRELVARCSYLQLEYWRMPGHGCLGFETCGVRPLPGVKCVNVRNSFSAQRAGLGRMVVHVRYEAQLVESHQGCIV